MQRSIFRKALSFGVLLAAVGMLFMGGQKEHKVFDDKEDEFGMPLYRRITEKQLVMDATFSGVVRKKDKLYSTYDRSKPAGKRACPT